MGWQAYYEVLTDRIFIEAVFRNLVYVGVVVGANLLIGMGYALLTYKAVKGIRILRTILVLPILFIPAVTAVTWSLLYNEQIGLINHFLMVMGFTRRMWLASGKTAFPAVMITDIWGWTPFVYLVLWSFFLAEVRAGALTYDEAGYCYSHYHKIYGCLSDFRVHVGNDQGWTG
ncbi:hypothetical protein ES703_111635 [subsurface metagenome]